MQREIHKICVGSSKRWLAIKVLPRKMQTKETQKESFPTCSSIDSRIPDLKCRFWIEVQHVLTSPPTWPSTHCCCCCSLPRGSLSRDLALEQIIPVLNHSIWTFLRVISWNRPPGVTNIKHNELHLTMDVGSALHPVGLYWWCIFQVFYLCLLFKSKFMFKKIITLISPFFQSSNRLQIHINPTWCYRI